MFLFILQITHNSYLIVFLFFESIRAQKIRTTAITKSLFKTNLPKEYYVNKLTGKTLEVEELQKRVRALQEQLATATAQTIQSTDNNTNNNVNNDNLLAQAEIWKQKIDKIFNDIRAAQENYYTMSSKEKLLKLRTKCKENTEHNRKMFNIDGEFMKRVSKLNSTHLFIFQIFKLSFNYKCNFNNVKRFRTIFILVLSCLSN